MKIYLSGGMKSGWQDIMPSLPNVQYFDPRIDSPQTSKLADFVKKDLELTLDSDLIFAYMEKSNPTGFGMTWECAVAAENDIPIITVWEKDYIDPFFAYHSLYLCSTLDEGIKKLESFIKHNVEVGGKNETV